MNLSSIRPIIAALALLAISAAAAAAQDTVLLRDGRQLYGTVKTLGRRRLQLDEWRRDGTLQRSRDLRLVREIRFADGRAWSEPVEIRRAKQEELVAQRKAGLRRLQNFSYLCAPAGMALSRGLGVGVGLGYERRLRPGGNWTAAASAVVFLTRTDGFYKKYPRGPYVDQSGFYAAPALQYHSFGNARRCDLSIGLELPLGLVTREESVFDNHVQTGTTTRQDLILAAGLVAGLRIYSSRAASIMFTAGGGPVLLNNAVYGGMFRAAFCFGLRH